MSENQRSSLQKYPDEYTSSAATTYNYGIMKIFHNGRKKYFEQIKPETFPSGDMTHYWVIKLDGKCYSLTVSTIVNTSAEQIISSDSPAVTQNLYSGLSCFNKFYGLFREKEAENYYIGLFPL